jgi:AcrR family transcriptional regulator
MSVRDTSIDPRLIQSAREEFLKNGFIKADLKTICDNAGITTGAVYKRYSGKEELFCAVVQSTVDKLIEFTRVRAEANFTEMTDAEMHEVWVMREEYAMDMFKMLWEVREDFYLLLEKSAGTKYENFRHDFADSMSKATYLYYLEARKRGMTGVEMPEAEIHILCSSFWTSLYEPFIHRMSKKDIEKHCKVICRFFDWTKALEIK